MSTGIDFAAKRDGYITKSREAFKAGKMDEGVKFRKLAEKAQQALEENAALDAIVALPGSKGTVLPTANGAGGGAPATIQGANEEGMKQQAVYISRFGDQQKAVDAILRDLHGNHVQAYFDQWSAFSKYLRVGKEELDRNERKLLEQVVFTPALVKSALAQGVDGATTLKATMVEAIGSLGGFATPVDFQARVIERIQGFAIMRGKASVDQTSRDMVEIPVATGGDDQYTSAVRMTWVDETPTAGTAATDMRFGLESIPIHTVMAEAGLSRNSVEDAAFNLESYLIRKIGEASAIDEDNRFLTGSGVGTPQGILPNGTNALALTEKASGGASTLTWPGLISLSYAIASQYRQNACWIAERATYEAIAKLVNGAGDYLWEPYQYAGGANAAPAKLLGYPVMEQESMPSIAANAFPIIFGDPGGYQIFDRVGMTVERYLDSNTARQNMIMFVMRRRVGAQVVEPWRFAVQKVAAS